MSVKGWHELFEPHSYSCNNDWLFVLCCAVLLLCCAVLCCFWVGQSIAGLGHLGQPHAEQSKAGHQGKATEANIVKQGA
jgi:hypothetical protein